MTMTFESKLAALSTGSSLEREMAFQALRADVADHEKDLLKVMVETGRGPAERTYLLALLADQGSAQALPTLKEALGDPVSANRTWARRGIARLTGVREEEVEEPTPHDLLFSLSPRRPRYLQLVLLQEVVAFGAGAIMLVVFYFLTRSATGVSTGLMVLVMTEIARVIRVGWRWKEIDRLWTIRVAKGWIEGPSDGGRRRRLVKSQLGPLSVKRATFTPKAYRQWTIDGPGDESIGVWEGIYDPADVMRLRSWLSTPA